MMQEEKKAQIWNIIQRICVSLTFWWQRPCLSCNHSSYQVGASQAFLLSTNLIYFSLFILWFIVYISDLVLALYCSSLSVCHVETTRNPIYYLANLVSTPWNKDIYLCQFKWYFMSSWNSITPMNSHEPYY